MTVRLIGPIVVVAELLLTGPAYAADPAIVDCLTASETSLKFGSEHRLLAEQAQLLICAANTCPDEIRKECLRRVDEVTAAIPNIVLEVKDGSGKDLSAVQVTLDGAPLAERLDGTAMAIDPGEHLFVFKAEGQPPVERRFVIRESQKDRREVIVIGPANPLPPPQVANAAAGESSLGSQRVDSG